MLANLRLGAEIGGGSFGKVCKAEWKGQPVAVKTLHQYLFDRHDRRGHVDNFEKECKILQGLEHRNVVRLLEFVISHSSPPMLITELLVCDIVHYIGQHHPDKIPLTETVSIALDVAEGLIYLHHECNPPIVHRDLATKNVLLTKEKQAKIADLGLAKCFPRNQSMHASPVPGTPAYAAPETYSDKPGTPQVEYSAKIDIFSFGVMLMEMINGSRPKMEPECPFEKDGRRIPEKERRRNDISMMGEHKLRRIVLSCIEDDSAERPNARKIVNWLQKESCKIKQKLAIARRPKRQGSRMLKVVLLGESGAGKTSIVKRFVDNSYSEKESATIGQETHYKSITLHGMGYCLQLIDTAGQERYHSIPQNLLRDVDGVLLVFDLTDRTSFEDKEGKGVSKTLQLVDDWKTDNTSTLLVGNKAEAEKHQITRVEAEEYAQKLGVRYFETSAKTGQNIEAVFEEIVKQIYDTLDLSDVEMYFTDAQQGFIVLTDTDSRKKGCCERMRDGFSSFLSYINPF